MPRRHKGSRRTALTVFKPGVRRGLVVSATPWPLYCRERDPLPILQKSRWASGPVWMDAEFSLPPGLRQELISKFSAPPPPKAHFRAQKSQYCFFHKDFIFIVYFFQVFRQTLFMYFLCFRCVLRAPHVSSPPSVCDRSTNTW